MAQKKPFTFVKSFVVTRLGLEPRITVPKTGVLPLHYRAIFPIWDAKYTAIGITQKRDEENFRGLTWPKPNRALVFLIFEAITFGLSKEKIKKQRISELQKAQ